MSLIDLSFDSSYLYLLVLYFHFSQHIPFFIDRPDEEDDYFNIPTKHRNSYLSALYDAGVRYVFTGHLHRNVCTTWIPPNSELPDPEPLHLIASSSVSVQLGTDQPGIRLVYVSTESGVRHVYYSLDQLEAMLDKGEQPKISTWTSFLLYLFGNLLAQMACHLTAKEAGTLWSAFWDVIYFCLSSVVFYLCFALLTVASVPCAFV